MLIMYDEPFAGLDPISLNTIANLIHRLNDALGLTSIVVTYDVSESLKVADYVYFIHDGCGGRRPCCRHGRLHRPRSFFNSSTPDLMARGLPVPEPALFPTNWKSSPPSPEPSSPRAPAGWRFS